MANQVAALGLPDHDQPNDGAAGHILIDEADWSGFLAVTQAHRLAGLVAYGVRTGSISVTESQRNDVAAIDQSWQNRALELEQLLVQVCTTLFRAGIDYRVIKGSALAHTAYSDPSMRVMGDIDLVIRGRDLREARRIIMSQFATATPLPELRPGFDATFGKETTFMVNNMEIDVHRTLVAGPFGLRLDPDELFTAPINFSVGGTELRTLPPAATFVQVCFNAALGDVPPRLSSLRDVAQVLLATQPNADHVLALAEQWGAEAVVQHALRTTWNTLQLHTPHPLMDWARNYETNRLDTFLLQSSVAGERSYRRQLASVLVIERPGDRLRYLRAIVDPQPAYLRARGWTRGHHVRRALQRLAPGSRASLEKLDVSHTEPPVVDIRDDRTSTGTNDQTRALTGDGHTSAP